MVIVIQWEIENEEEQTAFGPFENGDIATYWASAKFPAGNWYWLPLETPN